MEDPNVAGAPALAPNTGAVAVAPAPAAAGQLAQAGAPQPAAIDAAPAAAPAAIDIVGLAAALAPLLAAQSAPTAAATSDASPAPSLAVAAGDALEIGQALLTHQPIPTKQARALAIMALAAGVPALAHAIGQTPAQLTPWLNGAAVGLAFVGAAIGDFTGLFKGRPKT